MSSYAPTAIKAVEADRQREILLFRPEEVEDLANRHSIDELIKRKRKAFRVDGKVWFAGQKGQRTHGSKFPLPNGQAIAGFVRSSPRLIPPIPVRAELRRY